MLILNEGQQIFAFGFLQEGKWRRLHLLRDLFDDALGVVFGERLLQEGFGVFQAAFADVGVGQGEIVELVEDVAAGVGGDFAQ